MQGNDTPLDATKRGDIAHKPLEFLYGRFTAYIEDRRREPRSDVMTQLATATFPDGTLPEVHDVMLIAANLFAAGQETTARMFGTALRTLGDRPELQQLLRDEPEPHSELHRGVRAHREPDPGQLPPRTRSDHGGRRRHPGGHHGDGAGGRREP